MWINKTRVIDEFENVIAGSRTPITEEERIRDPFVPVGRDIKIGQYYYMLGRIHKLTDLMTWPEDVHTSNGFDRVYYQGKYYDYVIQEGILRVHGLRVIGKGIMKPAYESAGYDLVTDQEVRIEPHSRTKVELDLRTEFDPDYVGLIFDRGSIGNKGVIRLAGVVDADYRDTWKVILHNTTNDPVVLTGAIAQVVFVPCAKWDIIEVEALGDSLRGQGHFNSSGRDKPTTGHNA